MIIFNDNVFYINTKNTSYVFKINKFKHLEHIYYGAKVDEIDPENHSMKYEYELGSSTSYEEKGYMLNHTLLEVSTYGKGDYREPTLHIELQDGTRTLDFTYQSHEVIQNHTLKGLPSL